MNRQLWRVVALSCAIGALAWPALAQDPPKPDTPKQEEKKPDSAEPIDISGNWDLTLETQQGPMTVGVTFKVEKDTVTGTLKGPQGDLDVKGTVSATELAFSGTFSTGNGDLTIAFTGAPGKDKMEGKVDFGGRGGGAWSAQRAKP